MQILVTTPFTLNCGGGEQRRFEAGVHDVEKDIAEHWYVKAHSKEVKKAKAKEGEGAGSGEGAGAGGEKK